MATVAKGYDLDYACARWGKPTGAAAGQQVEREPYNLLFGQRKGPDGQKLGRAPSNAGKAAEIYQGLLAAEPGADDHRRAVPRIEAQRQARQSPLYFDLTISWSKDMACYRPGDRPHLSCQLHVYRRRKGEAKGFTWAGYRDLITAARHHLSAPLVWVQDNLTIHLAPELAEFARENKDWLRVYRLPAYTPELNPAEGIWSLTKRSMANFAAAGLDGLVRIIKRKLKKIQYRPHLIDGCLAATGLKLDPR